jgi:hypothetical protein
MINDFNTRYTTGMEEDALKLPTQTPTKNAYSTKTNTQVYAAEEAEQLIPEDDEMSYKTINSDDPTHENYEPRHTNYLTNANTQAEANPINSSPRLEHLGSTRDNPTTKPAGILKIKPQQAQQADSAPNTHTPTTRATATSTEWNVVSSTKRKANTPPTKPHQNRHYRYGNIYPAPPRKSYIQSTNPSQEEPARKNSSLSPTSRLTNADRSQSFQNQTQNHAKPTNAPNNQETQSHNLEPRSWTGSASSSASDIGIFQQTEEDTLEDDLTYQTNQVPRYQRDYESDYESPMEESLATQDDDSLPDLVLPSIYLDDDGPPTPEAYTQVPDRLADSEESNHVSSTKEISDYIHSEADSEFASKESIVPTSTEARTNQAQSKPSWLSLSASDVGSHHEQVLASWRSIFGRPVKPTTIAGDDTTAEAGNESSNRRRFRQEHISSIDPDSNSPMATSPNRKQQDCQGSTTSTQMAQVTTETYWTSVKSYRAFEKQVQMYLALPK